MTKENDKKRYYYVLVFLNWHDINEKWYYRLRKLGFTVASASINEEAGD